MTAPRPGDKARPFGPDELDGVSGILPDELAAETRLARDLEAIAARDGIIASADFADRVMAAVVLEPVPAPAVAAGSALRHAALIGFLASVRDAFRVTFGGGFPMAVRAQALALILIVAGATAGTGYVAAGALGLLGDHASPSPSIEAPSQQPSQTAEPTGTPDATFGTPSPSPSPEPSMSDAPEPSESAEGSSGNPGETAEPGGDSGSSGSSGAAATRTPTPTAKPTPKPTATPTATPEPTHTHEPDETPKPTRTPSPSPSPSPTPTPEH